MKIFNTMTRRKEDFAPVDSKVKMYVCGVTPYDNSHIGHAMSYVFFDTVRRYLAFRGFSVMYVQNITDIDDKIINKANTLKVNYKELAEKYAASFREDMEALNIMKPDVEPRATAEIPDIINTIKTLISKGFAYEARGSVYFRVSNLADYGKLAHRTLDSMMAGARVEPGEEKEHPMDFVLWKAAKPGEPSWTSPWGEGRPGWHIECTAMSTKYLGSTLDIHGGGQDLIFPHHENEIAQSEAATGIKPFVRIWMHNGLMHIGEDKMSKSLGNIVTIKSILEQFSADAVRLFILSSHYRSPLNFSDEGLEASEKGVERLRETLQRQVNSLKAEEIDNPAYRVRFVEAMDDDFNTSQAIAVLFELVKEINKADEAGKGASGARAQLSELGGILGFTFKAPERPSMDAEPLLDLLVSLRKQLRTAKQFQLADEVRNRLAELGFILEDTADGTVWKRKGK